jgi:hypothetical protein
MELMLIFLVLLILLDIVALYRGCDSRDSVNSAEWERRRQQALRYSVHHF